MTGASSSPRTPAPRQAPTRVSVDRTFDATLEEVWELCSTKQGLESWWGPDGFSVTIHALELRAGGSLRYTMAATDPEMIAGMKAMGLPLSSECHARFTEVEPLRRIAYLHTVDFVAGVPPYEIAHTFELTKVAAGVRLVISFEKMHDEEWTGRATLGWTQELGKLARILESRRAGGSGRGGARARRG